MILRMKQRTEKQLWKRMNEIIFGGSRLRTVRAPEFYISEILFPVGYAELRRLVPMKKYFLTVWEHQRLWIIRILKKQFGILQTRKEKEN